jgi:hypothetical protein
VQPYAGTIAQAALSILLALLSGLAEVIVAILLAFFFYRDGRPSRPMPRCCCAAWPASGRTGCGTCPPM